MGMTFGGDIFMALIFVTYIAGITDTVSATPCGYANLVDTKSANCRGRWGNKNLITWDIEDGPSRMGEINVKEVMRLAFQKWAAATRGSLAFKRQSSPDIRVSFKSGEQLRYPSSTTLHGSAGIIERATITFDDNVNWSDDREYRCYQHFTALHAIGHALGLPNSIGDNPSIMSGRSLDNICSNYDAALSQKDIAEIKALYESD